MLEVIRYTKSGNLAYKITRREDGVGVLLSTTAHNIYKDRHGIIKLYQIGASLWQGVTDGQVKVYRRNSHELHKLLLAHNKQRLHVGATMTRYGYTVDSLQSIPELKAATLDCIDTL